MPRSNRTVSLTAELGDAVDNVHLAVLRCLYQLHVTEPLDRCAVLSAALRRLTEVRDEQAMLAHELDAGFGALARAMGVSRQAARDWIKRRDGSASP